MNKPEPNNPSPEKPGGEETPSPNPVDEPIHPADETRPMRVEEPMIDGSSGSEEPPAKVEGARPPWKPLALLSIVTLLIIAGISAFGGYRSGLQMRTRASSTEIAGQISAQFELGIQDLEANRLDLARQRFEWVIDQDPGYPGVTERLAEVLMRMSITATATIAPTPTLTPTPDLRSVEELWTQSQQLMAGGDWNAAIDTLLKLRKNQPDYHAIEVDGLLYVALRNRGVDKIKRTELESGTYDLALASRFGPLDSEARNWRDWAEFYITGASFWEVDWLRVIEYFSQLAPVVPNLADGSGWTATDRLRIAYIRYGDQIALTGDYCLAQQQYEAAFSIGPDPEVEPTAQYAADKCAEANAPPPPPEVSATPTVTPTPGAASTTEPAVVTTTEAPPATTEPAPAETEGPPGNQNP